MKRLFYAGLFLSSMALGQSIALDAKPVSEQPEPAPAPAPKKKPVSYSLS